MSRPALVVGLGGTGQWVLTWLKRDLLLANDNQMPDNVRLLAIDTVTQLEAGVAQVASRREEDPVQVGSVTLQAGEFIYVGGDSRPLAQQVKGGARRYIGKWFHAERWLDTLPPATFILDDGAGRIRQFGRIAIFNDILGQETGSKIWRALRSALESVRRQVDELRRLEIIVVGSFAGGTGSGMFLDIALILRLLADQMGVHHVLRGFFALPSVFTGAPDDDMKARTFAAWRELNRFMVVNSDFPMPVVQYVENAPHFEITPTQRLFDACYLVDSKRKGVPIAADAKLGAHPMVAEVISAILDEYAGTDYTQYIFTNLAPEYASTPNIPLFSAIGSYTIQVPAHYKQEVSTLDFTQDVLRALLTPKDSSYPATGAERHLLLAAPDQNQERGIGFPGRTHCRELLSAEAISYGGESAKPTAFTARIADIVQTAVDQNRRAALIDRLARAGSGVATQGGRSASWIPFFANLGNDPQIAQLRQNVQAEANYSFVTSYQRGPGQSAAEVRANMKKIPEEMRKRCGGLSSLGVETYGSFGAYLDEAHKFHLVLFRNMARLRLLDILMGRSDQDPIKSKSGKLGYAWDYFDGLVNELETFLGLMDEVKKRREEVKPGVTLQERLENARRFMAQNATATIFGFERPVVKSSEDAFLQAQQRVANQRKEEILHHFVVQTAKEMKAICANTRDAVQRWIWHLSTGDDPTKISGLISDLTAARKSVEEDHTFDARVPAVQRLIGDQVLPIADEDVAAALHQWEWLADFDGDQLLVRAQINPEASDESALPLTDPTFASTAELRQQIGRQNQEHIMSLARRRFAGIAARTTLADEIQKLFPNPKHFASQVAPGAEPLFDDGGVTASARRRSNLIRVMASANDPYFYGEDGLEGHLRLVQNLDPAKPSDKYNIRVVNSENPYKLTLVRTDDLYPPESFAAWRQCMAAYASHLRDIGQPQDPVLMHNFSAEANAVRYERQFVKAGQGYRPLHPRLVMLLENTQALRHFLYLGMLGMVHESEERGTYRWELTWTKGNQQETFWLTRGWNPETDQAARPVKPDIMNAIHGYVIKGQTWQTGRHNRIDYEFADRMIKSKQQTMGPDNEREMLQHHMQSGFIAWLKSQAFDPNVPERVLRQDFADLAKVADKMLNERLDKLNKPQDASSGPWRTGRPRPVDPKARVQKLLENENAVRQFLYLGMLGMVQPQQDSYGYRWQLALSKSTGDATFWLTPSWARPRDANRPEPDLIDALEGYILVRKSQQPRRQEPIDYELAQHQIAQMQQQMGDTGEINMLQDQLDRGFVAWLNEQAYDPDVPGRVVRQDFAEFATKARQILSERIEELTRPVAPVMKKNPFQLSSGSGATRYETPSSPFATSASPPEDDPSRSTPW